MLPGGLCLAFAPERVATQREANADPGCGFITSHRHTHHCRDEYSRAFLDAATYTHLFANQHAAQFPYAQSHPRAFAYLSADLDTGANAWHTAAHAF
jgi:hypothetical protein